MVLAAFLWSIAGVFTRHLDHAKSFEVTFWRSLFCALTLMVWFVYTRGTAGAVAYVRASGRPGLLSGLCWAVMFTCFMIALTMTSTANVLIVNALSPLFATVLAWAVLKAPIARRTWLAIATAFAGMLIMFASQAQASGAALIGMAIAFGVPVAAAVNIVTLKRTGAHVDLAPAILLGALLSCAITLPLSMPMVASAKDVLLLAILGIFQLGIPCVMMVRASAHLTAPEVALLGLLEVLMGPLWSWLGAGEAPGAPTLVGGAIVLAALVANEIVPNGRRPVRVT
ncbi:MAG: DMT family transporter [Burkholderiales bacterium]|nr:DMT family transporter [Burkholderiales bacterium]